MTRNLFLLIGLLFTCNSAVYSQSDEIKSKLKDFNIGSELFINSLEDENATFSFDAKITNVTSEKTSVQLAHFDPSLEEGVRWKLISVNGSTPNNKELKAFNKHHNKAPKKLKAELSDDDYWIDNENETELVIAFRYNEDVLPHKYAFLAHCTGKLYLNKETKRIDHVEYVNDELLHVSIFKVDKLNLTQKYQLNEEGDAYFLVEQKTVMDAILLGQSVEVIDEVVYSNYKKVK